MKELQTFLNERKAPQMKGDPALARELEKAKSDYETALKNAEKLEKSLMRLNKKHSGDADSAMKEALVSVAKAYKKVRDVVTVLENLIKKARGM